MKNCHKLHRMDLCVFTCKRRHAEACSIECTTLLKPSSVGILYGFRITSPNLLVSCRSQTSALHCCNSSFRKCETLHQTALLICASSVHPPIMLTGSMNLLLLLLIALQLCVLAAIASNPLAARGVDGQPIMSMNTKDGAMWFSFSFSSTFFLKSEPSYETGDLRVFRRSAANSERCDIEFSHFPSPSPPVKTTVDGAITISLPDSSPGCILRTRSSRALGQTVSTKICLGDGPIGAPGVVFPSLKFPAEKQPLAIICWDHLREIIFTRSHRVEGSGAHTTWIDFYFMNDMEETGFDPLEYMRRINVSRVKSLSGPGVWCTTKRNGRMQTFSNFGETASGFRHRLSQEALSAIRPDVLAMLYLEDQNI